ncbi:hypothetical protein K438DRAFT_1767603 [Mycena galopus ATCC 62051]|nr:hypothetical protein K438DRAFT_1767603 [Mycena galopus ATCC 62051]
MVQGQGPSSVDGELHTSSNTDNQNNVRKLSDIAVLVVANEGELAVGDDGEAAGTLIECLRWSHLAPPGGSSGMRCRVATSAGGFFGELNLNLLRATLNTRYNEWLPKQPPTDVATRHRMPDEPPGGAGWLHRKRSNDKDDDLDVAGNSPYDDR